MSLSGAMNTGVSGLLSQAEGMNVIGNNISNVNTIGFKGGRTLFSDTLSANIGNGSQIGRGTQIQKVENIFSQGNSESTELVTDLAIQGSGFFEVTNSAGKKFYTRAGDFKLDSTHKYFVNPDGLRLSDTTGTALDLSGLAAFDKITKIDTDGTITWIDTAGTTATFANKIGMAIVPNPGGLEKVGGTVFKETTDSGVPAVAAATVANKISSNSLEQSNVDMASQFVKMIMTQRAYSANSKTITTSDEMTQEVISMKR